MSRARNNINHALPIKAFWAKMHLRKTKPHSLVSTKLSSIRLFNPYRGRDSRWKGLMKGVCVADAL